MVLCSWIRSSYITAVFCLKLLSLRQLLCGIPPALHTTSRAQRTLNHSSGVMSFGKIIQFLTILMARLPCAPVIHEIDIDPANLQVHDMAALKLCTTCNRWPWIHIASGVVYNFLIRCPSDVTSIKIVVSGHIHHHSHLPDELCPTFLFTSLMSNRLRYR